MPGRLRAMVQTLLGTPSVAEPLFELLMAKGEGNPLYVEEIIRQLQETEGIVVEDGEARLRAADVTVPGTIRDIIAARVDRLDESPKQTLQVASVVGRRFGITLVSRVRESDRNHVAGDLQDLHAVDFVFPSAHDPELMYSFKHALTQDVVYTSLLERRRRRFHAAAGTRPRGAVRRDRTRRVRRAHRLPLRAQRGGREGRRLRDPRRREGPAPLGQHGGARLLRKRAQATRGDAGHAAEPGSSHRRGRQAVGDHVRPRPSCRAREGSGGDPRRGRGGCRPAPARRLVLVDRLPAQPGRSASRGADRLLPRGARRSRTRTASTRFGHSPSAASRTSTCWRAISGRLSRRGSARSRSSRRAGTSGGRAGRSGASAWPRTPRASGRASLEACRRALEHGQALNDLRLKVVGWWRTGSTHVQRGDSGSRPSVLRGGASPSHPIPFDAAMARAGMATA